MLQSDHSLLWVTTMARESDATLMQLRMAAVHCQACPLWEHATQTIFGEGSSVARVMLVGEQPGDQEDLQGRPFVGPAGKLLDRALIAAEVDRRDLYLTNAVKHFKWEPQGSRRLHKKPNNTEIAACNGWLRDELRIVKPEVLVCLGATAGLALLGKDLKVMTMRGKFLQSTLAPFVFATLHPSAILRVPKQQYDAAFASLVSDLKLIHVALRD